MRAALCKSFDGPDAIELAEIANPEPAPGQVVVRVRAAALNFFDTLMTRNRYQFTPDLPFSPCAEIAGEIERLGAGVTDFAVGDRVLAYIRVGGARERALVDAGALVSVPDAVTFEDAAGLSVTYGTAIHGLKDRAQLKPGETLAVLGASGGAGLAAVEAGNRMGARVIAVASAKEKLEACRAHGASEVVNYAEEDLKERLKSLTGGKGVDVIYDCVGGPYSEPALRAMAWKGRFLVVGFAAGEIPKMPLNLLLLKGCAMVGVFWGEFLKRDPAGHRANIEQVLDWVARGELKPLTHGVYPLEEIRSAIELLVRREAIGKVIIAL